MNHHFLVFSMLTVIAVTVLIIRRTPAQVRSVWKFQPKKIENGPTLFFLHSENEPCLGTLIHEQWILTAAHCLLSLIKINIAAKEISLNKTDKLIPILFLQHPNFTMETPENNLMLIKLHVPLTLTQMVLAVLPNTMDDREGEKCTLFTWGWSRQSYLIGLEPDMQMNRSVFFLPNALCQEMGKSMKIKVTKKMFCAGSSISTIIPCEEMTAAPILCQNQLYGILSWSKGCALRGDTGYYTKISHYTDWILKVIRTY